VSQCVAVCCSVLQCVAVCAEVAVCLSIFICVRETHTNTDREEAERSESGAGEKVCVQER